MPLKPTNQTKPGWGKIKWRNYKVENYKSMIRSQHARKK